jgi:hypothetical protein
VTEYEIILLPGAIPLITPVLLIVAILVEPLPHTPPDVISLRIDVDPTHKLVFPVIGLIAAYGSTVITIDTGIIPQLLVTV